MLSPPPGSTFDIEEEMNLPVKNVPKESNTPEQVPLLASDSENPETTVNVSLSKTRTVRVNNSYSCISVSSYL